MALENSQGASVLSSSKFPTSARALALVAMGLLAPNVVEAQPRHGRHRHETAAVAAPAVAPTPTCAVLSGTHTTQEWMANAQVISVCLNSARDQFYALDRLPNSDRAQLTALAIRVLDTFADMMTAYTHAISDASDFSPENITINHDLPFHLFLDFDVPGDVWNRFGARMLANGNAVFGVARRPGISTNIQRELVAAGMGMHMRASHAFRSARTTISPNEQGQVAANLALARAHTSAEWQMFAEVTFATSRNLNTRIVVPSGQSSVIPSSPDQAELAVRALDYYLQALTGYVLGSMTATDRVTNPLPQLTSSSFSFEPRAVYEARDWYFLSTKISGLAAYVSEGNNVGNNATVRNGTRFELLFRSVEGLLHALNDGSDSAQMPINQRRPLLFNMRLLATALTRVEIPALPRVMPPNASSVVVAEVQRDLTTNNLRRRNNLQVALDFRNLSVADKLRMRLILINWLRQQDDVLGEQLIVVQNSLRPIAQQGLRVCTQTPGITGDNLLLLREFVCPSAGSIDFERFVSFATNPALIARLPQRLSRPSGQAYGPDEALELTYLDLFDGQSQATLPLALEAVYRQWYLLHFIHHSLEALDRDISVTTNTPSVMATIRLAHAVSPQTTTAALGELTATDTVSRVAVTTVQSGPVSNPENNIASRVLASPETAAHRAWNTALAARNGRVRTLRRVGFGLLGGGAALAVGAGIGNLVQRGEAEGLISTPEWQARVTETNMFIANARAGMYNVAELEAGNARIRMYAQLYRDQVEGYNGAITATQILTWTGVGIAVFGGALAALADVIAGPVPVEPRETNVPAAPGQQVPHPAPAGRRAEVEVPGVGVTPNLAVDATGVSVGATVTF